MPLISQDLSGKPSADAELLEQRSGGEKEDPEMSVAINKLPRISLVGTHDHFAPRLVTLRCLRLSGRRFFGLHPFEQPLKRLAQETVSLRSQRTVRSAGWREGQLSKCYPSLFKI